LSDENNPRSLAYQVQTLSGDLELLERERPVGTTSKPSAFVTEVADIVSQLDSNALATPDDTGARVLLDQTLEQVADLLMKASDALTSGYFTKQPPQQQYTAVGFTQETGFGTGFGTGAGSASGGAGDSR